jgi:hypothetical protein
MVAAPLGRSGLVPLANPPTPVVGGHVYGLRVHVLVRVRVRVRVRVWVRVRVRVRGEGEGEG